MLQPPKYFKLKLQNCLIFALGFFSHQFRISHQFGSFVCVTLCNKSPVFMVASFINAIIMMVWNEPNSSPCINRKHCSWYRIAYLITWNEIIIINALNELTWITLLLMKVPINFPPNKSIVIPMWNLRNHWPQTWLISVHVIITEWISIIWHRFFFLLHRCCHFYL